MDKPENMGGVESMDKPENMDGAENMDKPENMGGVESMDKPENMGGVESMDKPGNMDGAENMDKPGNMDRPEMCHGLCSYDNRPAVIFLPGAGSGRSASSQGAGKPFWGKPPGGESIRRAPEWGLLRGSWNVLSSGGRNSLGSL